jgi:hypothetical protein
MLVEIYDHQGYLGTLAVPDTKAIPAVGDVVAVDGRSAAPVVIRVGVCCLSYDETGAVDRGIILGQRLTPSAGKAH